jgi:spore coat protein CotF
MVNLKQNVREEVTAISLTMLQRVMQNFQKRLWECVNKERYLYRYYIQEVNIVIKTL